MIVPQGRGQHHNRHRGECAVAERGIQPIPGGGGEEGGNAVEGLGGSGLGILHGAFPCGALVGG